MPQYLLSVYQPEGTPPEPDALAAIMERVAKNEQEMKDAGVWLFSGGLEAQETATVVRATGGLLPSGSLANDDVLVTDGPFVEAKEYLGGLTIIEVDDLDEALRWGRRTTLAIGLPIEVRPFYWAKS
ncbi:YciI family protein [Cryptosporangium sp. NPDC048952]|uniref:YciI family protein n=1 Tax=Cryptosporangium sp. NPDC048952 TaxID=3363961 RepID=UPI0037121DCC